MISMCYYNSVVKYPRQFERWTKYESSKNKY